MKKLFCCTLILLLVSCSTTKIPYVDNSYDPATNFSNLKTFSLDTADSDQKINPRYLEALRFATRARLEEKGLTLVKSQPDFLVSVGINKAIKTTTIEDASYLKRNLRSSDGKPIVLKIAQGSVFITMSNPISKKLIFGGIAKSEINRANSSVQREERIALAVREILKDFPPLQ